MPTKATTLFSLAKCRTFLDIKGAGNTADDDLIIQLADGISENVEQMTSRKFVTQTVVEKFDARGKDAVLLRQFPVISLTQIRTRAHISESWATEELTDFELDGFTGKVYSKNGLFPSGPLTTEVTASVGYGAQDASTLPAALVQNALAWLAFAYKRHKAGYIVSSTTMGGGSIVIVPKPPQDITDAIMRFKKYRGIYLG